MNAAQLSFARDLADPNFSLSVPSHAKKTIRLLLAERADMEVRGAAIAAEVIADLSNMLATRTGPTNLVADLAAKWAAK